MNTNSTLITYLIVLVAGYLIGSISFARLIFKKMSPDEEPALIITPTTDENVKFISHAIGATNVMIRYGPRLGILATLLDVLKAFLPVILLRIIFPNEYFHLLCAVMVLIGHLWPIWYRFSGGGGNSCIMGMLLAISPVGLLVSHGIGMTIGRFAPAFNFLGGVMFTIPWFIWRDGLFSYETLFAITITLLYLAGEIPEIIQISKLKKQGISIDMLYVKNLMKHSSKKIIKNDDMEDGNRQV